MPKVATISITFITLLLAFLRFHFRYSLSIFQCAIYIPHYLCSVVVLLHTFAHGKNSVMQHVQHGTAKYLHTILAIWCKINHTIPKNYLLL